MKTTGKKREKREGTIRDVKRSPSHASSVRAHIRFPEHFASSGKGLFSFPIGFSRSRYAREILLGVSIAVLVVLAAGAVLLQMRVANSAQVVYRSFQETVAALGDFDAQGIREGLDAADRSIGDLPTGEVGIFRYIPVLKQIPEFFDAMRNLQAGIGTISRGMDALSENGLRWMLTDGGDLLETLRGIRGELAYIDDFGTSLRNRASQFDIDDDFSTSFLAFQANVQVAREFLEGAEHLVSGSDHLVVFFENPSELRPGGGFIGSYADLSFRDGRVEVFDVEDILYPDRELKERIVPPKPIRLVATSWGARDANWFFDFPTSAEKVINLLEASSVYAAQGTVFRGAVGVNIRVLEDVLRITGPIELPEYGVTVTAENVLREVQREVSRQSWTRGSERKNIVKDLAEKLLGRAKELSGEESALLVEALGRRLANKDIRLFFEDRRLQSLVASLNWGGEEYVTNSQTFSDYLAIANATINGGKTDAVVTQRVKLASTLDEWGGVKNNLSVTRRHNGSKETASFYREVNRHFLQIIVPFGSKVESVKGNSTVSIRENAVYAKEYARDEDVERFEKGETRTKALFGYWMNLAAGASKTLKVSYEKPGGAFSRKFRFVYEKQSGLDASFEYSLQAPPGFIFRETGRSIFTYASETPPARLIFDLTLDTL